MNRRQTSFGLILYIHVEGPTSSSPKVIISFLISEVPDYRIIISKCSNGAVQSSRIAAAYRVDLVLGSDAKPMECRVIRTIW